MGTAEGKVCGSGNMQKKWSLSAKVKLLRWKYCTVMYCTQEYIIIIIIIIIY